MKEKTIYWLEIAQYDLDTAAILLDAERFLYVAFCCHQSIEKLLKAFWSEKRGDIPPKTHSLTYLAEETGILSEIPEKHIDTISVLEPLNIQARYPEYKQKIFEKLTKAFCSSLLLQTKELFEWIRNKLS